MFEGDEDVVVEEFGIFATTLLEQGIEDKLYLLQVADEDADTVEAMMYRNLEKSEKLTSAILVYLALPAPFNPEWN